MFLTNQPFQRGWETQKNRPLIKVNQSRLANLGYRTGTTTKHKIMYTYGITRREH